MGVPLVIVGGNFSRGRFKSQFHDEGQKKKAPSEEGACLVAVQ